MKRRAILGTAALLYLYDMGFGLIVTAPLVGLVWANYGDHPLGERALYRDGGLALFDLLMHADRNFGQASMTVIFSMAFAWLLGFVPLAALVSTVAPRSPAESVPAAYARSIQLLLRFLLLSLIFGCLALASVGGGIFLFVRITRHADIGDSVHAIKMGILAASPFALLALLFGIWHDVGRVAVADEISLRRGLIFAARAFPARAHRFFFAYAWRWLVSLALAAGGLYLGGRFSPTAPPRLLVMLWLVHQVLLFTRVGLRASSYAAAGRLLVNASPTDDRSARNGVPAAPNRDRGASSA